MHLIILLSLAFLMWLAFGFFSGLITLFLFLIGIIIWKTGLVNFIQNLQRKSEFNQRMMIFKSCMSNSKNGYFSRVTKIKALKRLYSESNCYALQDFDKNELGEDKELEAWWKYAQSEDQDYFNKHEAKRLLIKEGAWDPILDEDDA